MARMIDITTPLGPDLLLFHAMHAHEELGRVGEYHLVLLSRRADIDLDQILGHNVTITLALPDDGPRYFNGFVARFSQSGTAGPYYRYFAIVRPSLWFLSRTSDCRIFPDMTVPEIVKTVFADHDTITFIDATTETYRKWTYCVQYRETDLNFVSRLLEQEGIYYYVKHAKGRHTVVLADSYCAHEPLPGRSRIPFVPPDRLIRPDIEHISSWELTRELQPGVFVHEDYDFERPNVELRASKHLPRGHVRSAYEVFDYPGEYLDKTRGEQYAAVRIEEFGAQFERAYATTNVREMTVGSLFTLDGFPRADQNREHLVISSTWDLEFSDYEGLSNRAGASYHCSFAAMPATEQFRPARISLKPFVQGPQTAVVVGPPGDEIHTDKYGRVKVRFRWDRDGKARNEHSSCWVRVAQPWAGKGWGAIAIPRVGNEVVVDFLEGDPDQPIVTGSVYNGQQMPPYALPANMTQTGIKSRSSLGGSPENFNEIRFEDKKDAEEFFMQAERTMRMRVKGSESHTVGGSQTLSVGGDQSTTITNDHTVDITEGGYNINVKQKKMFFEVLNGEFHVHGKKIWHIGDEEFYADVHGNTLRMDKSSVSITSTDKITLTCGGSKIELTPVGIEMTSIGPVDVKGMPIKLNS